MRSSIRIAAIGALLACCVSGCFFDGGVYTQRQAIRAANHWSGLDALSNVEIRAEKARLTEDHSASATIRQRMTAAPVWRVTYDGLTVEAFGERNLHINALDVYIDPSTGQLLKIASQWPSDIDARWIDGAQRANAKVREQSYIHGVVPAKPPGVRFEALINDGVTDLGDALQKHVEAYCMGGRWALLSYGWISSVPHGFVRRGAPRRAWNAVEASKTAYDSVSIHWRDAETGEPGATISMGVAATDR